MVVLGIDPGLALTGWGVVRKKEPPVVLEYGCIRTKAGMPDPARLSTIFEELGKIIDRFRPQALSLEKLFFNTNAKTALMVGEARGIVKLLAAQKKIRLVEFTPLQIKTTVAGYGRADKRQVQQMVKNLLRLKEIPQPDDAADALSAALTYCFYHQNLEK